MSVGSTDFGIAAAPNGHLASLSSLDYCSSSGMIAIRYHPVEDTQSAYRRLVLYSDLPSHPNSYPLGGGVRFDLKGNLYVGLGSPSAPVSPDLPSVITSDPSYKLTTGRINRYTGTGSLDGDLFTSAVSGPNKIYDVDFGQLGNSGNGVHCYCMTAMFGVDGWGRLYAPDGMFQKVTVLDNEGNRTARFGTYGNVDNVAVEASGNAATKGKCYMSYPWDVDASDNYIYVSDPGNLNVLRYKKVFVLDNVPGLSADRAVAPGTPLALFAAPNPLVARCGIRVVLPRFGNLTLDVVDVRGHLVKRIASGPRPAGVHVFNWDGGRIAAGLYFLRLASDAGNLTKRIVILR